MVRRHGAATPVLLHFDREASMPDSGQLVPGLAVECVILGFNAGELKQLLLRLEDGWSLPGARVYAGGALEEAALQLVADRTGSSKILLHQFHTFGARSATSAPPNHNLPPDHWILHRTISVGYLAMIDIDESHPTPDAGAAEARWFEVRNLPALLLDQDQIVSAGLKAAPFQLRDQPIGLTLLPEKFTMPELQKLHEAILGRTLDRRNFKKKMIESGIVERLPERKRGGAYPAPYLYRFDAARYEQAANEGTLG